MDGARTPAADVDATVIGAAVIGATVSVRFGEAGADPDRLALLADGLTEDLRSLDGARVTQASAGPPPPDARGMDLATLGELVVVLGASATLVRELIGVVADWRRARAETRTVEVTIGDATLRLGSATADQQQRLIEDFLRDPRR